MVVKSVPLRRSLTLTTAFLLCWALGCSSNDSADSPGAGGTGGPAGGTAGQGLGGGAGTSANGGTGATSAGTNGVAGPGAALSLNTTDLGGCQLPAGYFDLPAVPGGHPVDHSGASALEVPDPNDPGAMHSTHFECSYSSGYFSATIWNHGIGLYVNLRIRAMADPLARQMAFDFTLPDSANEFHGTDQQPCVGAFHEQTATRALIDIDCQALYGSSPDGVTDAVPSCALAESWVYLDGCTNDGT